MIISWKDYFRELAKPLSVEEILLMELKENKIIELLILLNNLETFKDWKNGYCHNLNKLELKK